MCEPPYSEYYRLACEATEAEASKKLGRPLTDYERSGIWSAGSLMMLESVDRGLYYATTPEQAAAELADAATAFQKRHEEALQTLVKVLSKILKRAMTETEVAQIKSIRRLDVAMSIHEQMKACLFWRRERRLRRLLAELEDGNGKV